MDPSSRAAALAFTVRWLQNNDYSSWNFDRFNEAEEVDAQFRSLLHLPSTHYPLQQSGEVQDCIKEHKRVVFHMALRQLAEGDDKELARNAFATLPQLLRTFPTGLQRYQSLVGSSSVLPPPPLIPKAELRWIDSYIAIQEEKLVDKQQGDQGQIEAKENDEEEDDGHDQAEEEQQTTKVDRGLGKMGLGDPPCTSISSPNVPLLPSSPPASGASRVIKGYVDATPTPSPATAISDNTPDLPALHPSPSPHNCFGCCKHFLLSSDSGCNSNLCCIHPPASGPQELQPELESRNPTVESLQTLHNRISTLEQRVSSQEDLFNRVRKVLRLKRKLDKALYQLISTSNRSCSWTSAKKQKTRQSYMG